MTEAQQPRPDGVILYDGVCVLCSGSMRFVARRDGGRFRFTPIQSPYGRRLAQELGIDPDAPNTNAVILDGKAHVRSDGALAVLSVLPGWRWSRALRWILRGVRDALYTLVARHRYQIFGRHEVCDLGDRCFADRIIMQPPPEAAADDAGRLRA